MGGELYVVLNKCKNMFYCGLNINLDYCIHMHISLDDYSFIIKVINQIYDFIKVIKLFSIQ